MVNDAYEPDADADAVMAVLCREERVTPYLIREETDGLSRQEIGNALKELCAAGWVEKRTRGLYDYVADPRREDSDAPPARTDPADAARDALATWDPADVDSDKARQATVAVVGWLASEPGPRQKGDVLAWADEQGDAVSAGYAPSTLWDKVVQPGLKELVDDGLLSHRRNVGYAIVEKE